MPNTLMNGLIEVQTCDVEYQNHLKRLASFPQEIAAIQAKLLSTEQTLKQWRGERQQLLSRQQQIEIQIQAAEEKVKQYEAQQISVQKQDAYEALNAEIMALNKAIKAWEDEGIDLLLLIDRGKDESENKIAEAQEAITELKRQIDTLQKREKEEKKHTLHLKTAYQQACDCLEVHVLQTYQTVKSGVKRPPYIVPLTNQQCTGCHLRISREVFEKASREKELARCDQCGRIVYRLKLDD